MRKVLPFVATLLLGFGLFVAAETVLPHDFEAGDLLSAAAMNENFAALAAAIDALAGSAQRRVADACPAGSAIRVIDEDGGVICEEDNIGEGGGGGDVTAVAAGTGLTGGGVAGDLALELDTGFTDTRYYPRAEVDARIAEAIAANPGPAGPPGEDGSDGASVRAELSRGELTVCNDAGTPAERCTTETVRGSDGSDGADGADGVSGYEIFEESTDFSSPIEAGSTFGYSRVCPGDKRALGGGGSTSQIRVVLTKSQPIADGAGWRVSFYNPTDEDLDIEFTITIVCADVT